MSRIRKGVVRAWLVAMAIIISSMFVVGCSTRGNIYTLAELVERNELTVEDIKNIAALRNGSVQTVTYDNDGNIVLTPVEYSVKPIESEVDDSVKSAIVRDFEAQHDGGDISLCEVTDYYGTYGGYVVAEVKYEYENGETAAEAKHIVVSGIYLGMEGGNLMIVAWRQSGEIN